MWESWSVLVEVVDELEKVYISTGSVQIDTENIEVEPELVSEKNGVSVKFYIISKM